ncbi:MAG: histidinol-phosphate transaminase [Pseudomonadota bacterium]
MITAKPEFANLSPYGVENRVVAPGKTPIPLDVNESLRPPSPAVGEAITAALGQTHRYPDAGWAELRAKIALVHELHADKILCGPGSLELIGLLIRAFAGAGDEVLSTQYAYAYFRTATHIAGATYVAAPEAGMSVSVDALLAAVTPRTRIVCLANPGNPTGTVIPAAEIRRLRDGLPATVLLIIDQAYGEFVDALAERVFDLVDRGDTVIFRTLSKAYGLAGIRVGWGLFPPEAATAIRKLQPPGSISGVSQAAAIAAVSDQAYMHETVAQTVHQREAFATRLAEIGIETVPSRTNFILLRFSDRQAAKKAEQALRDEGVMPRAMGFYGLPDCLRITIGQQAEMDLTAGTLARLMEVKK